ADPAYRRAHRADVLELCAEVVVVLALLIELAAMFGNVVYRTLFNSSLLWSLEIGELALVVMTFIGGALAYPRNEHMSLHALVSRLPPRWRPQLAAFATCQVFAMAVVGCVLACQMLVSRWDERTIYLGLRAYWFAVPMTAGMALLAWFAV